MIKPLMSKQALQSFSQLADTAPQSCANSLDGLASVIVAQCRGRTKPNSNHTPARMSKLLFEKKFSQQSPIESVILQVSLIAKLAKITPTLIERENLPDSILAYYPAAFDRLSNILKKVADNPLDANYNVFNKISFVLVNSIPCGSQIVDLRSIIPFTSVILSVVRERSLRTMIRYFRNQGLGTWFRGHADAEYLEEFNEDGREKYYLRVAELLLRRKNVRGLVGTSWYYDPQLVNVSPRLSYLQLRPLERGAFVMRHRGTESDIKFATKTSPTRRRLYEEGKYIPVSHSQIWGRHELLKWAKKNGLKTD